ncbi:HAD family hydrolase [Enterococcus sp. HY326]|uniref:HAD family hydrolase n=1 Tax=Enterococcus sp. HY326 TaxID=2971265 RepID=UPI00223E9E65|nr:HAD family phosphatase [Enterococcus sp. HY326]
MIKQIVFDLGNVLVKFQPTEFIKSYTQDAEVEKFLLQNIFQAPEWIAFDRGTITKAEIQRKLIAKRPDLKEIITEVLANWYHEIKPFSEMATVVSALQKQGYPTYLLSNAPTDIYEILKTIPALENMSGLFISADWKTIKPEKEIYRCFCSHFGLVPRECLFIDDLAPNVEAAQQSGMESIVFRQDVQQLKAELATFDIII